MYREEVLVDGMMMIVYTKFSFKLNVFMCLYGLCVGSVPVHCSVMPFLSVHHQVPRLDLHKGEVAQ